MYSIYFFGEIHLRKAWQLSHQCALGWVRRKYFNIEKNHLAALRNPDRHAPRLPRHLDFSFDLPQILI